MNTDTTKLEKSNTFSELSSMCTMPGHFYRSKHQPFWGSAEGSNSDYDETIILQIKTSTQSTWVQVTLLCAHKKQRPSLWDIFDWPSFIVCYGNCETIKLINF